MKKLFVCIAAVLSFLTSGMTGAEKSESTPVIIPSQTLMDRRFIDVEPIRKDPVLKWKVRSEAGAAREEWTNCIVYKGVMYGSARWYMHAIDIESGKLLWKIKGPGGHPTIQDDTLYAAGASKFYAIDPATGKIKYETECGPMMCEGKNSHGILKPSVVLQDGVAYFGTKHFDTTECYYHAVDIKSGKLLWKIKPGNEPWTARPAVGGGRFYGSCHLNPLTPGNPEIYKRQADGNALVALDLKTGEILWKVEGKNTLSNPIYLNEVLYVGLYNCVQALDAKTGKLLWEVPAEIRKKTKAHPKGEFITGLALHDNILIASGAGAKIIAIDIKERKVLWDFREPKVFEILSPIICRDVILVTTAGHAGSSDSPEGEKSSPIVALDLKTGKKLWQCMVPGSDRADRNATNSYVCGWAYPEGNKIFVFSFTGYFYCFEQPK
jgi:outer membrane protein assembly factor BamB